MLKCLELTAYRKALVKQVELDRWGLKARVDYVHYTSFSNPLPNESIVTEVSAVPILGKTLGGSKTGR